MLFSHPNVLPSKQNADLLTFTYALAEDKQHVGIFRVVCDLHLGDEGQVPVGETFAKVIRGKDSRPVTSGHIACQDHL